MDKTYRLNPFCFVTDTPAGIIMNAVADLRVTFAREHRAIVDLLIARDSLAERDLLRVVAPTRLQELVAKKVLLDGPVEELGGRYSRQNGYFSMTSDTPQAFREKLTAAHVLILGVGAIGSHVLWNLAAIGIGKITILDFDVVEESNFNRQLMYNPADLGEVKVDVIGRKIREFNPEIEVVILNRKIGSKQDVCDLLPDVDLVVKAIDTPEESNGWVNSACVEAKVPFIIGGFLDYVGMIGPNYIPGRSTCHGCLGDPGEVRRLHGTGATFAPLTTTVASKMSMIAFKILVGDDENFADKIFSYDTRDGRWIIQDVVPVGTCATCAAEPPTLIAADPVARQITMYRSLLIAGLILTIVLREFFEQQLIGVLAFAGVLMTVPVIYAIHQHNAVRARREFFVVSCIYIAFSLVAVVLEQVRAGIAVPGSFAEFFENVRVVCAVITQAAVGVTLLFLGMCGLLEYTPRVVELLDREI